MKIIDLSTKIIKAVTIEESDPVYKSFQKAVLSVQQVVNSKDYQHPMVELVKKTFVLNALTGSNNLIEDWTRKFNNVPCIALIDKTPTVDDIEDDPLGYFYNTTDLTRSLASLDCDKDSIEVMIARSSEQRKSYAKEINSCICIKKKCIEAYCKNNNLDIAATIEVVLWHEIGHLVFNPSLYKYTTNSNITREAPATQLITKIGIYKRSKPYQFAVEGLANWFAFHAKDWSNASDLLKKSAKSIFHYEYESESEYSYFLVLNMINSETLVNIVLSFYFNCIRSGLFYLPVDTNGKTKLIPSDFLGVDYKGKDLLHWSSYGLYVLKSMKDRKISTQELVRFSIISDELLPFSRLDDITTAFIGLQETNMKLIQTMTIPSIISTYNSASDSDFDDYMISNNETEAADLLIGLKFDGYYGQLLGISNFEHIRTHGTSWWISITFLKEDREVILFSENSAWKELPARQSAYFSWIR